MSKARQCIIKAAALRAQADKLEEVALLADQDADSGDSWVPTVAKATLGLGALGGAGALGLAKGRELGLTKGHGLGLAEGSALALRQQGLQRAKDLKSLRNKTLASALATGGTLGVGASALGVPRALAGILGLVAGIGSGAITHSGTSAMNQIKEYIALKRGGLW